MPQAEKVVRYIAPKASVSEDVKNKYKQKRVAAYCRVSTQQEEQINSYEVQTRYYTEKINSEPKWKLVRIFADKGISGTSTKHRDEFNKMIRMCKRGRIDMIITKSISRFARNTVDCLKYIRMLKDINVDVFFEEQGIHSIETFGKVQEEIARRSGLRKVKQVGTKTELGKYSSKYSLTELLICGECGTPYRRCTWTSCGNKRIVWRCISRLDYGKKRCHDSPTMGEEELHRAIMRAIQTVAMQNSKLLQTLKNHIAMTVKCDDSEDKELEIKVRLAEINEEFQKAMSMVSIDDDNNVIIEQKLTELIMEKELLNKELAKCSSDHKATSQSKINEIARLTDILENQPLQFNDELVRQMLQCIVVESKERIKVIFNDGIEIDQPIL